MAPNTRLDRMATTRPRYPGGVTSPKMVWVGTTYTRFAMPMTPAARSATGSVRGEAQDDGREAHRQEPGDDHPALPEVGTDESDRQSADEVADADERLEGRPVLLLAQVLVPERLAGIDDGEGQGGADAQLRDRADERVLEQRRMVAHDRASPTAARPGTRRARCRGGARRRAPWAAPRGS